MNGLTEDKMIGRIKKGDKVWCRGWFTSNNFCEGIVIEAVNIGMRVKRFSDNKEQFVHFNNHLAAVEVEPCSSLKTKEQETM